MVLTLKQLDLVISYVGSDRCIILQIHDSVDALERVPAKNLAITNIYVLLRGPLGHQVLPKLTFSFAFVGLVLQKSLTG